MGQIVVLNGPAAVGKTSVAHRLAQTAANSVVIAGDDLKRFVVNRQDGQVQQGLAYVGAAKLADVYLEAGYELVVVDFVFEHPRHVQKFRDALTTQAPVMLVTLWASLVDCVERNVIRARGDLNLAAVERCWVSMHDHLYALGEVVDAARPLEDVTADVVSLTRGAGGDVHPARARIVS